MICERQSFMKCEFLRKSAYVSYQYFICAFTNLLQILSSYPGKQKTTKMPSVNIKVVFRK